MAAIDDLIRLGLRYERLLIFAAPLTFASLLVLFVGVASVSVKERANARCYDLAANILTDKKPNLDTEWDKSRLSQSKYSYDLALFSAWLYGSPASNLNSDCFITVRDELNKLLSYPTTDIIAKFRQEAKKLNNTTLEFYNIEIPHKTTLTLLGTDIKIGLMTFIQLMQIALGPLIILWLGALYATRLRESLMIGRCSVLSEVFPHTVNIYPMEPFSQLNRSKFFLYPLKVGSSVYAILRIMALLVFIGPAAGAYIFSLYYLHTDEYVFPLILLGSLIGVATLSNIVLEFFPWHFRKIFSHKRT
jgi:hypothetical protein